MLPIIYIAVVLIVQSTISVRCEEPPLKTIYDVVPHFPKIYACNRDFTTTYRVNRRGVRIITFTGSFRRDETAESLCRCIHGYQNQVNWLDGSTSTCSSGSERNTATLTLRGNPDPNFKEHKPENVLLLLQKTFDQFPLAQIDRLNCRPKATDKRFGCFDFKVECDLLPNSLDTQKICDLVLDYINQDKWLGKLSSPCTVNGNVLKLDITSDLEPANCKRRGGRWNERD